MILGTYSAPPFCFYLEMAEVKNYEEKSLGFYIYSTLASDLLTVTIKTGIKYMT